MAIRVPQGLTPTQRLIAIREGGIVNTGYLDSEGVPTIGIGCTGPGIEVGMTWTDAECVSVFFSRFAVAETGAILNLGNEFWSELDDVRKAVLIDLDYQDGSAGEASFKLMLAAIRARNWAVAAAQCMASHNLVDSPSRCRQNAQMLATGAWPTSVNGIAFNPQQIGVAA